MKTETALLRLTARTRQWGARYSSSSISRLVYYDKTHPNPSPEQSHSKWAVSGVGRYYLGWMSVASYAPDGSYDGLRYKRLYKERTTKKYVCVTTSVARGIKPVG